MTVKTINMINRQTRSHVKNVSRLTKHSELSTICSTLHEYLVGRFAEKGYNELTVRKQIERVDHLDTSLLLKHCKPKRKDAIPFC